MFSGDSAMSRKSSVGRPKEKYADVDESHPLLSSDNKSRRPECDDPYDVSDGTGIRYFIKGKNPTSLSVVADSEIPTSNLPVDSKKQSSIVTIFVLWNTMVGTSLLAMPWGIEKAGFAMGILLVIAMAALCCYTAHCNVSTQAAYGPPGGEISELTRHLLGRKAELLSTFFSYVVLVGALIIYWILMTNFLYFIVVYIYTALIGGFDGIDRSGSEICLISGLTSNITADTQTTTFQRIWNLETTVPIYLIFLLGPLLCFKSVTFFTKFNSLGILSLVYLMLFVLVKAWGWGVNINLRDPDTVHYSSLFKTSFFATSGMLAMSYFLQNIVISIMRSNRNQKNNARDLAIAYSLGMGTYLIIGIAFYVSFPLAKTCIGDQLLNNFASWDVSTLVARVFLFFQLVTVFPLISFMLRYQFMTAFFSSQYPSRLHIVVFNAVVVAACVLFAVFLPSIGDIIRWTGALSGFCHIFTLPCLLRLAGERKTGQLTVFSLILHSAIPLIGGINLIAQFFI